MQVLGQTLTENQIAQFNPFRNRTKDRVYGLLMDAGFIGTIALGAYIRPSSDMLQSVYAVLLGFIGVLGCYIIYALNKWYRDPSQLHPHDYLVFGSAWIDWPFGVTSMVWTFAKFAIAAVGVGATLSAGWYGITALIVAILTQTQIIIYLRADLALKLLK